MATVRELSKIVNDLAIAVTNLTLKIDNNHKTLCEAIVVKLQATLKEEISKAVIPLKKEVDEIKSQLLEQKEKFEKLSERYEADKRSQCVIISGIKYEPKENINQIVDALTSKLGFESVVEYAATRIHTKNSESSLIKVKFSSARVKNEFMTHYFKFRNLAIRDVFQNCNSSIRIYVNHDLSKKQQSIHKQAIKLLKDKKIKKVRVTNSLTAVRFSDDEDSNFIIINNLDELIKHQ